jgi:hypothetical protein
MSTATTPNDPGSSGDPSAPDTGTRDKVAAGSSAADANVSKEDQKAQQAKEVRRAEALGISGATKMKRADLQAELSRPENFSSLLDRDTTHFDNVHYGYIQNLTVIGAGSDPNRVQALKSALLAAGYNVEAGVGWDDPTEVAVVAIKRHAGILDDDDEDDATVDRATWDAIGDALFSS